MIDGYAPQIFLLGLLFIVGLLIRMRANKLDDCSDLGKRLAAANRASSNLALIFGTAVIVIAIPIAITIHSLSS